MKKEQRAPFALLLIFQAGEWGNDELCEAYLGKILVETN